MLITDSSGSALSVNRRWSALSGFSVDSSLGLGWLEALTAEARHGLLANLREVAAHSENLTEDYQITVGSQRRWVRWWISHHEVGGVPMLAVAAADVEADYARQADLYHLATHDSLTGLFNRRHFMEAIDQALLRNQRSSRHVGVVYVDLDGFKGVNDRAGHAMGDRVLSAVGARLRHAVRSADLVARIGGDEFAVLCEGLGEEEQAEVVASRIASALAESVALDVDGWSLS
jgi:diguanylate cyclase (GGDEF)-like protein